MQGRKIPQDAFSQFLRVVGQIRVDISYVVMVHGSIRVIQPTGINGGMSALQECTLQCEYLACAGVWMDIFRPNAVRGLVVGQNQTLNQSAIRGLAEAAGQVIQGDQNWLPIHRMPVRIGVLIRNSAI